MKQIDAGTGFSFTSPRVRGEVGAQRRVRETLHAFVLAETPPHPNPLPAGGERELCSVASGERH
jgi:hypothetical protein